MKVLMIGSANGGSAKTTVAVRLVETLSKFGLKAGIVDLSPYPTASYLAQPKTPVLLGRSASTPVAARCVLKPYVDQWDLAIIDTGRLDDPVLDHYAPLVNGLILTTRPDPFSLRALQTVGTPLQRLRGRNPGIKFLGFLPVLTSFEGGYSIMPLRQAAGKYMINHPIGATAWEWMRAHRSILGADSSASVDPLLDKDPLELAFEGLGKSVLEQLELEIPVAAPVQEAEQPKKEVGALTKLWRSMARAMGPKATVEGYIK
jgi:hypothetical protein